MMDRMDKLCLDKSAITAQSYFFESIIAFSDLVDNIPEFRPNIAFS